MAEYQYLSIVGVVNGGNVVTDDLIFGYEIVTCGLLLLKSSLEEVGE